MDEISSLRAAPDKYKTNTTQVAFSTWPATETMRGLTPPTTSLLSKDHAPIGARHGLDGEHKLHGTSHWYVVSLIIICPRSYTDNPTAK